MILERSDQAISTTDLQRKGKALLDQLQSGEQDKFVVMRENKPAVVMLSIASYEALLQALSKVCGKSG